MKTRLIVPVIGLLCLTLLLFSCNSGGGGGGTAGGGNSSAPVEPSGQEKIQAALASGVIDYGTSLLYRAYVFFGDARLPDAFLGSGSQEEDNNLRSEIIAANAGLTPELRAALEPFTVRPADPTSWYNQTSAAPAPAGQRSVTKTSAPSGSLRRASRAASGWNWISDRRTFPVRVWAQTNGDPSYDAASTQAVQDTLDIIDKIWVKMTNLMGEPIYDQEGGDNAIDLYIVDWMSSVHRRGEDKTPNGFGSTFYDFPVVGKKTSAFILLPRSTYFHERFHTTVIHELFHVLQKAHNHVISEHWFVEASARWASVYYDRTCGSWQGGRKAWVEAHQNFTTRFQNSKESLNASTQPHMYDAYIWAYFMEQKAGGPEIIGGIWTGLESASTFAQADNAIDFIFPFKDNFRTFAFRNLNTEFLPGDPLPISERYVTLDMLNGESEFKEDKKEPTYGGGPLTGDSELSYNATLEPLSADYVKFTVNDPTVKQVVFDLSGLTTATGLDVDALIKTKGKDWEKRDLNGKDELKFCFDKPGDVEALDDIRLILSNHQYRPGESVPAGFTARSYKTPCAGTWSGTFSYTNAYSDASSTQTVVWSGTVTWGHPVIVNSWTTTFTPDSVISTVTVDGTNASNGCTFHGEKAVAMSEFLAIDDVMTLFSDGRYTAGLSARTTVTVNYVCPDPPGNSSAPYPLGVGWYAATTEPTLPQLDINNHMKGNFVMSMAPNAVSWTWDFAYAP